MPHQAYALGFAGDGGIDVLPDTHDAPLGIGEDAPTGAMPSDECNISGGAHTCPVVNGAAIKNTAVYKGVRSDPGNAVGAIDVHGACRYVNNTSAASPTSVWVPFNTATEWQNFYTHAPSTNSFLSLPHCSKPQGGLTALPSAGCPSPGAPVPATVSVPDYYPCTPNGSGGCMAPFAPTWVQTPTQNFTCNPPAPGAAWVETARATFPGLDSDLGPSWGPPISTTYTATAASCGSAHGTPVATAPVSGFCNVGSFSGLSGTGPWTWSCTTSGSLPSRIANCTAAYDPTSTDPCVIDPASCAPVDPCVIDPASCAPVDPCVIDPASCAPVDPCVIDPASCAPVDPCVIDPASCATVDPCVIDPA
ncbi:MAG: hypothetical protein WAO98_06045, partial [Alphaproteobacteria bacterium]